MRTFSGQDQFQEMQNVVLNSYKGVFPVEKNGYKLELEKIWIDNEGIDPHDYTTQKKTKLAGGTWGAPVQAALVLKDPAGKVLDRMPKIRLATIPRLTPRGSYIVSGNEYQVSNQMIRKPGAYVVKSQKGDTFKGMFSLSGDRTQNFEVHFDPTTNKYKAKLGQSFIPLYPLLKSLGTSDKEMMSSWGEKIFNANKQEKTSDYLKLADKLARAKTDNQQTAIEAIQAYAKTAKVDPTTTKLTLGKPYETLHRDMVLDTSKKILNTYQGHTAPDDPENLLFKEIRGVEDMLQDRLGSKKEQDGLKRMLMRNLGRKNSIKQLINFKKLTAPVESFFTNDNRTSTPEQYNPIHMVAEQNKLTIHGTGGITSEHAVTNALREVHPSHIGFIDPTHTPESGKIGTTMHISAGVVKDGRNMRTFVRNAKTGKGELLTPQELYSKTVAFPDEVDAHGKFLNPQGVRVQTQGKVEIVPATKVDYALHHPTGLFSHSTNLIPFLKNNQGTRAMMAAKQLSQAIPLVEREAPLVQTTMPSGKTFHEEFGKNFSVRAEEDGVVREVTPNHVVIGKTKIPLYNNFPLNQHTHIHHTPLVAVGDKVKKGQLIADSNYTKNGSLAVGKNLNVAYLPYHGWTFEDGIVVTESGAKKLAAEQTYRHTFKLEQGQKETNLSKFVSYYPNTMTRDMRTNYDDEGIVKKGMKVKPGQILIAGLNYAAHSPENLTLRRINKNLTLPWSDASVKYTGEFEGTVTDVVKRGDQIDVYVKAVEPARASDKLSGVHGNKGVITKVIPDSEAPRTKDGKVPDVFLNPHGIIGRINLGQLYESAASKIAEKTGKTYVVHNFDHEDTGKKINEELKKHGVTDVEEMVTPDGKPLGKVHIGKPYILRLAKTGKTGFSARMPGQPYDTNLQPIKGGEEGAKSLDQLTFFSMLSHGAKKNLLDAHMKSERNDEFWHAIETGKIPPTPQPSFAYNKFIGLLKGAGINTERKGADVVLAPMTDKDTLKVSKGKIKEYQFMYGKNLEPIKGGFFDPIITGGLEGKHYGHLELHEPLPNPVFEGAVKSLTGLKQTDYDAIVAGTKHVSPSGQFLEKPTTGSKTGGAALHAMLSKIDLEAETALAKRQLRGAKNEADMDRLNRKIRYLAALKDLNLKPQDAYMRKLIPVVPPIYRPILEIPGMARTVAPPNYLYQNVGILSEAHNHPVMNYLDDSEKTQLRAETYKATRALAGLEPVLTRGKAQPIEGFISQITGSTPKQGFFLNKLVTKKQDLVGRGVAINGPDLHMDEIGIPEKMAKTIFRPFTMREYTTAGIAPTVARKEIEDNTPRAKQMLEAAMKKRTVLLNRAPSLHKFSILAFKPKLTDGLAVKVPPLVFKGLGMDIDGDTGSIHVPVSEEALKESIKMLPSNNLWKPGTGELMTTPSHEAALGVYLLSSTPQGRAKLNAVLPKQYHVGGQLMAKDAEALYNKIAKESPKEFPNIVHNMRILGETHAYESGFSSGLQDLKVDTKVRDAIFRKADQDAQKLKSSLKAGPELDDKVADIYEKAAKEAYKHVKEQLKGSGSSFYHMIASGARGKDSQLQQLISAPGIVRDAKDKRVPVPIKKSYAEGITTSDYFMSSYGARKGMIDRAIQTSAPGALNKDIMASVTDHLVHESDCGVKKGVTLPITSSDVYDRHLAHDQHGIARNTLITPQLISALQKKGVKEINVRSPLRCLSPKGVCAHCFGKDENGNLPEIGDNVGAKSGQAMSEPLTQMTMRTFHTGGLSTGGPQLAGGFERIQQLLNMPKYVAGEAALSETSGKVSKIEKTPAGGFNIHVADKVHTSRPGLTPQVKVGDAVNKGDKLTSGVIRPQELLRHKGMREAQNYITDELQKTYHEQGIKLNRKTLETVVRAATNNTRVIEAPKQSDFLPGDVIPHTTAVHYNEHRKLTVPPHQAVGFKLKDPIGKLPQFHEITDKDVPYLRDMGYNHVEVLKDPLIHAPLIKGITQVPMLRKDWMAQLGYRYINKALTEGAAQAWKSNIEGSHPIPAFAYGASFGKKKEHY